MHILGIAVQSSREQWMRKKKSIILPLPWWGSVFIGVQNPNWAGSLLLIIYSSWSLRNHANGNNFVSSNDWHDFDCSSEWWQDMGNLRRYGLATFEFRWSSNGQIQILPGISWGPAGTRQLKFSVEQKFKTCMVDSQPLLVGALVQNHD